MSYGLKDAFKNLSCLMCYKTLHDIRFEKSWKC